MKNRTLLRTEHDERPKRAAADWFVDIDAGRLNEEASAELEAWLLADSGEQEDALGRCAAAMFLGKQLAASFETPRSEAAPAPDSRMPTALDMPAAAWLKSPALTWIKSPALAWSITGLSLLVSALAFVHQPASPQIRRPVHPMAAVQEGADVGTAPLAPYQIGLDLASPVSAVVLPGQINVDARSLAVLPFTVLHGSASEDGSAANENGDTWRRGAAVSAELYAALLQRLAAIPGLYVADPSAVAPYSRIEADASELAADLGVRAVVMGRVATDGRRIQVQLSLTDGVNGAVLWKRSFDRPPGELNGIENDTVANVAAALAAADAADEQTASTAAPIHY